MVTTPDARGARIARRGHRRVPWTFLGVVPFFVFATMFLVIPTSYLVVGSFRDQAGNFTVQNYLDLARPLTANAYTTSIEISLVTAILGGSPGFHPGSR